MNCSVIICLILAGAIIIVNGYEEALPSRHRRHSKQESNQEIEEETGNGYEFEGLKGHAGLFSGFNWTRGELAKVSVWHATAQHYKVAELVEKKLSELDPEEVFPRAAIRSFLENFQPPASTKKLFNQEQIQRIKQLHQEHKVGKIKEIYFNRLMELDSATRQEIFTYFASTQNRSC